MRRCEVVQICWNIVFDYHRWLPPSCRTPLCLTIDFWSTTGDSSILFQHRLCVFSSHAAKFWLELVISFELLDARPISPQWPAKVGTAILLRYFSFNTATGHAALPNHYSSEPSQIAGVVMWLRLNLDLIPNADSIKHSHRTYKV